MKKESMIGRRLYAWIIDTILFLVIVFFIDGLISTPIMNKTTNIESVLDSYTINSDIYNDLQDEYELYIYDEKGNRIVNENISDEAISQFNKDERVIEVTEKLYSEQKQLVSTLVIRISLSILVSSSLVYLIIPLIFTKGRTLGKLVAKIVIINKNDEYITWYHLLARNGLNIIFNIYLAIITMGMMPIVNLVISIGQKDNKTIYDLICKTRVIDGSLPIEITTKIN